MTVVVAQQERAIEAQAQLIQALSGENSQQKLQTDKQPRVSVYITGSHVLEPAAKTPEAPPAAPPSTSPARFQRMI